MTGSQDQRLGGTRYRVEGSGPPLVLIHGVGLDLEVWDAQVAALAPHFTVYRYDVLGHGGSENPPGKRTLDDFAVQLEELLAGLGLDNPVLVGFSLGGLIVRTYFLRDPNPVSRVVLMYTVYGRREAQREAVLGRVEQVERSGPGATLDGNLKRWFSPAYLERNPPELVALRERILKNDPRGYAAAYRLFAEADESVDEALDHIPCPTLVLTGSEDVGSTAEMAEAMAERLANGRCVVLEGHRHMGLMEDPASANDALLSFLRADDLD